MSVHKPFFRLDEGRRLTHSIYGDVGEVSAKAKPLDWESGITTVILHEGPSINYELRPSDGRFVGYLKQVLEKKGVTQGYFICRQGTLRNIDCSFFLSYHKPFPAFADAHFVGENRINSLSGVIIPISKRTMTGLKVDVTPHFHIAVWNERNKVWLGGHVNDAESGQLKGNIIPLFGETLRRDVDPKTGVMHIRSDQPKGRRPIPGEVILFTIAPQMDFREKIFETMLAHNISKATLRFAVGTFRRAEIWETEKKTKLTPKDGLELLYAYGDFQITGRKFFHKLHVGLMDVYGRFYRGSLVQAKVKDLVEGVILPQTDTQPT